MTVWTTPTHVSSGEADSGKFNEEIVDSLLHLRNVAPSAHYATSPAGAAGFSTTLTAASTLVVPDQGCAGVLLLWGHLRLDRTASDGDFRVRLKDGATELSQSIMVGDDLVKVANPIGAVLMTSGSGKTIIMSAQRVAGSGTATFYADDLVNRLHGLFISTD